MDPGPILALATAHEGARALQVGVEIGVFAALARGPRTASAIARSAATDARATEVLCNALAALGLLRKRGSRFAVTPAARAFLVPGARRYLGDFVRFCGRRWPEWERLGEVVRTGEPARTPDYFQNDPEELEVLLRAMADLAKGRGDAEVVARVARDRRRRTLIDIGGGPGSYALALCRANPALRATLFDLPGTLRIVRPWIQRSGLAGRVRLRAGDYRRDPLGGPYDVALLFNIVHGEDRRENERLLRRTFRALAPGGVLLLKDHVLDDSLTAPVDGAVFALTLLLFTRGRCYSRREITGWLRRAGFARVREIRPVPPMTSSLIIAEKGPA